MTHQDKPQTETDPSPSHHPLFDRRDFDCCTAGGEGRPPGFDAAHLPTVRAIADWLCGAVAEPARLSGFALLDALAALPPQQQDEAVVCGVKHPTETSWIPCMLDAGHEGEHWSSSGCAGGQVRWTQPAPVREWGVRRYWTNREPSVSSAGECTRENVEEMARLPIWSQALVRREAVSRTPGGVWEPVEQEEEARQSFPARRGPRPSWLSATELMDMYRPGSEDWSWAEEFADIAANSPKLWLRESIDKHGIQEPVLLGDDGRVWEGHHRIMYASELGNLLVPVAYGTSASEVVEAPDRFSVAEIEAATEKALWGFSAHQKNRIRADLLAALRAGREGAAVGDLSQPPIVQVSDSLRALLNPCDGNAPSRGGYCGGVNGFHADDCPRAGREES